MVVTVEARKLNLPYLSISSSQIVSLLYEPTSLSLALMHSDSSFSLYSSFSPFSLSSPSLPPPQTLIPPPSSSACFVSLNSNPNPRNPDCPDNTHVVFVTAGPYNGGSRVVLRFNLLGNDGKFAKTHVVCSQNGIRFARNLGVIVDLSHGTKVLLAGSVNYLAMYSASAGKIWIFGVKFGGDERNLRLVKCAVIECHSPVLSIQICFGYLILGELHGVRVFPLRALVKGGSGSSRRSRIVRGKIESLNGEQQEVNLKLERRNLKMPNGVIRPQSYEFDKNLVNVKPSKSKFIANGYAHNVLNGGPSDSNVDGNQESVKPRSLKLRQDSGDVGMQFVLFNDSIVEGVESKVPRYKTTKAISIQALSQKQFLILDSNGDLHILHVTKSGAAKLRQLTGIFQVQKLAASPDISSNTHTIWLSDGLNSVHKLVMSVTDNTDNENENDISINAGKIIQSSVSEAIFTSESIQDVIPLAENTVLLLGQDSLYAYAIS